MFLVNTSHENTKSQWNYFLEKLLESKTLNLSSQNPSYICILTTQLPTFNKKDTSPASRISYLHLSALVIIANETCWEEFPSIQASWQGAAHTCTRKTRCWRVLAAPHWSVGHCDSENVPGAVCKGAGSHSTGMCQRPVQLPQTAPGNVPGWCFTYWLSSTFTWP